ncbi:MAG: thioesterase family protein [Pseudomonas sp.]
MKFRDLIEASHLQHRPLVVPEEWSQGRTVFGGLVVALANEAMLGYVAHGRVLRSLAVAFVAPVSTDQPLFFEAEVLREGSAVTHLHCRVIQREETVTSIHACYGAQRQSALLLPGQAQFELPTLEGCTQLPFLPGVTPRYLQHFDVRWGLGEMPFTGGASTTTGGWIRFKDESGEASLSESHLLTMLDAWPPSVLSLCKGAVPGCSLTWSIELVQPLAPQPANAWCAMALTTEYALHGYSACSAALRSADGQLLALGRQTVAVFG